MTSVREKDLDAALEQALKTDADFLEWFLRQTRFGVFEATYIWSRADHPWGIIDFSSLDEATGETVSERRESETDLLLVVEATNGQRLALHIENKLGTGAFTKCQPEMYRQRAEQWRGLDKYRNYTDFVTVLVAPKRFRDRHPQQCAHFDHFISHEMLAMRLPLFGAARFPIGP